MTRLASQELKKPVFNNILIKISISFSFCRQTMKTVFIFTLVWCIWACQNPRILLEHKNETFEQSLTSFSFDVRSLICSSYASSLCDAFGNKFKVEQLILSIWLNDTNYLKLSLQYLLQSNFKCCQMEEDIYLLF